MVLELSPAQKKTLKASSRRELERTFGQLRRHFARGHWLAQGNRYRVRCVQRIDDDAGPSGNGVADTDLAQYIAASAPLHCTDGWAYLGRALASAVRGDSGAARHLGYYAELRAAMSLLASEGIGVFNDRHFVLNDRGVCEAVSRKLKGTNGPVARTHTLAWLALDHWASLRRSSELLAEVVAPEGVPLREWLAAFNPALTALPIGGKWLRSWGLDLKRLAEDQSARNEASYRPTRLNAQSALSVDRCSSFLREIWSLCEPAGGSRFANLDRHLLRESLKLTFHSVHGKPANAKPKEFREEIESMLLAANVSSELAPTLGEFLEGQVNSGRAELLDEADGSAAVGEPDHHIQVIARAALLLRVATGASARLIRKQNLRRTDIQFWWEALGEEYGLWPPGHEPSDLQDLWADMREAITRVTDWENGTQATSRSYHSWNRECAEALSTLSGCESIGLWGLGI